MKLNKLLTMTDKALYKEIKATLPVPFIAKKDYIVTTQHKKSVPLICVHLDTVSNTPPTLLERKKHIVTAPGAKCLGADDRAGVYIALEMLRLKTKTDFEYGFFMGEEKGAIGSNEYGLTYPDHTAFIGLDRASRNGAQNAASYGYDNAELTKCFPYPESYGSISDCSVLSSYTNAACINLSVGFENEHSEKEKLNLELMIETLNLMLNVQIPEKPYVSESFGMKKPKYGYADWYDYENFTPVCCDWCGRHEVLYHMEESMLCHDCIEKETYYNTFSKDAGSKYKSYDFLKN